jgi:hypothetical protein
MQKNALRICRASNIDKEELGCELCAQKRKGFKLERV